MGVCLFWTSYDESFDCYEQCPMRDTMMKGEEKCLLQEHLKSIKEFSGYDSAYDLKITKKQ